jgi:prepilin-type N-terminal cleavage/methylation domain-containing protein
MRTVERARRAAHGFSMIELLVTVVLAGIIFAAMVPVFASALKATSRDNLRVTATNFAQDRIEKIRMLNYLDISSNLADPVFLETFAGGQLKSTFTPAGGGTTYTATYEVVPAPLVADPQTGVMMSPYKTIIVTVKWPGPGSPYITKTIVTNPSSGWSSTSPSASATPAPYSTTGTNYTLRVSVTDDDVDHTKGVTVVRTDITPNEPMSPAKQVPDATNGKTVSWTGLVGGPNVTYLVTVTFKPPGYSTQSLTRIVNLIGSTPIYFDTNPYQ